MLTVAENGYTRGKGGVTVLGPGGGSCREKKKPEASPEGLVGMAEYGGAIASPFLPD